MAVIFPSLVTVATPKLRELLNARPEPYAAGVTVTNKAVAGRARMVTVHQGPGSGSYDTLDDTTLRVNVYAPDEADAEDLAVLTRFLFETALVDGDPFTFAKATAGPVEVPNNTDLHQWYFVVDVTRRGTELT